MDKLQHIQGILNTDYRGQIAYTIALPSTYEKLIIKFAFDKQSADMNEKTEIHITAEQNGVFIGGVHKQLKNRILTFSPWFSSKGCLPVEDISGMLKINILVFRVLYSHTVYTLDIWGKEKGGMK